MSSGAEVMAAVRELSVPGLTQAQLAAKIGCAQSQVSMASTVLRLAPGLAGAVTTGRIGLARAAAVARETRQPPASLPHASTGDHWPPVYLTVGEAAGKLAQHRSAVLRLIHAGSLRSLRLGRTYRIPETEVCRHLAAVPHDNGILDIADCARILRCQPATVYALLHHGHLAGQRTIKPDDYRIPITEFQRFLSDATR